MAASVSAPLYNPRVLRLAADIPNHRRLNAPQATIEKRSPVCGSRITVDVAMAAGRVTALGQEVRACALGQASAALMGTGAVGKSSTELAAARDALRDFLAGRREDPGNWPGLEVLVPARPHPGRHASILLPWEAVAEAALAASRQHEDQGES